jgi:hypothetical protein
MSTQTASNRPSTRQMPETQNRQMQEMATANRQMPDGRRSRRIRGDETKPSLKSTEFWIYLASVGAVLLASYLVGKNSSGVDVFRADRAWSFITLLTVGYVVSRGIAKAGSPWRHSER